MIEQFAGETQVIDPRLGATIVQCFKFIQPFTIIGNGTGVQFSVNFWLANAEVAQNIIANQIVH
jgi:hypothetical protein